MLVFRGVIEKKKTGPVQTNHHDSRQSQLASHRLGSRTQTATFDCPMPLNPRWLQLTTCAVKQYLLIEVNIQMGVSKNRGTPKSSILIGLSIINHPFWDTPIFGNIQISTKKQSLIFQFHIYLEPLAPSYQYIR